MDDNRFLFFDILSTTLLVFLLALIIFFYVALCILNHNFIMVVFFTAPFAIALWARFVQYVFSIF